MLQLHLSDQQFNCAQRFSYIRDLMVVLWLLIAITGSISPPIPDFFKNFAEYAWIHLISCVPVSHIHCYRQFNKHVTIIFTQYKHVEICAIFSLISYFVCWSTCLMIESSAVLLRIISSTCLSVGNLIDALISLFQSIMNLHVFHHLLYGLLAERYWNVIKSALWYRYIVCHLNFLAFLSHN